MQKLGVEPWPRKFQRDERASLWVASFMSLVASPLTLISLTYNLKDSTINSNIKYFLSIYSVLDIVLDHGITAKPSTRSQGASILVGGGQTMTERNK